MSILVLKTEKKAQAKAIEIMTNNRLPTSEEVAICRKLSKLHNIEYINNMIIALLAFIYQILQIIAYAQNSSGSASNQYAFPRIRRQPTAVRENLNRPGPKG